MSNALRQNVLSAFKTLHRTRKLVFQDDEAALTAARAKINEEYKKCMHVKDETAINELLKYSNEVENILRTTVIQAKEVGPGKYEAKMRDGVVKLDNVPFKECSAT